MDEKIVPKIKLIYNIALADYFIFLQKNNDLWPKYKPYYYKFVYSYWIERGRGNYDDNNIARLAQAKPKLLLITTSS